jgi:hypothetical protein
MGSSGPEVSLDLIRQTRRTRPDGYISRPDAGRPRQTLQEVQKPRAQALPAAIPADAQLVPELRQRWMAWSAIRHLQVHGRAATIGRVDVIAKDKPSKGYNRRVGRGLGWGMGALQEDEADMRGMAEWVPIIVAAAGPA